MKEPQKTAWSFLFCFTGFGVGIWVELKLGTKQYRSAFAGSADCGLTETSAVFQRRDLEFLAEGAIHTGLILEATLRRNLRETRLAVPQKLASRV